MANLDMSKTQMQETGEFTTIGLTLRDIVEVVTDLGIDPKEVMIVNGSCIFSWNHELKKIKADNQLRAFGYDV